MHFGVIVVGRRFIPFFYDKIITGFCIHVIFCGYLLGVTNEKVIHVVKGVNGYIVLSCISKHHDELAVEFELIVGIQKELKESFEIVQTNWQNGREYPCLNEINRWEEEAIDRIRQVAAKARTTAK